LASAKDRRFTRVAVGGVRDSELGLDAIDSIAEHTPLNMGYILMKTIGANDDARNQGDDTVKARSSILTKFDVRVLGGKGVVHLKDLNHKRVMSRASQSAAIAARVEKIVVFTVMHETSKFYPKDEPVVSLLKVDYPETVNTGVSGLSFDHSVDHLVPTLDTVAMTD
jgi:hypothetical protein